MERPLASRGRTRQIVPRGDLPTRLSYRTDIALAVLYSLLKEENEQGGQRDELLALIQSELDDEEADATLDGTALVEKIRVIVDDVLEEMLDPDEGLEIAPEVRERLMRSLDTPAEELLTSEQMMRKSQG